MTIEKLGRNCAYAIGEFLYVQRYFGYTKREAVSLFKASIKDNNMKVSN